MKKKNTKVTNIGLLKSKSKTSEMIRIIGPYIKILK